MEAKSPGGFVAISSRLQRRGEETDTRLGKGL
jgi:hypothetical protein